MQEKMPNMPESERMSKYIYRSEGLPSDTKTRGAIDAWAEAWGEYVWQCKKEGVTTGAEEDAGTSKELKNVASKLEKTANALESLLPKARFLDGVVLWDGGFVELSI